MEDYRSDFDCSILTPNTREWIFPVCTVTTVCPTFILQSNNDFPVPFAPHQRWE